MRKLLKLTRQVKKLIVAILSLMLCSPALAAGYFFGWIAPAPTCSQSVAFLARNGNANALATATFICGGVTDGWWSKLDILYIHATDTSAHALLNWTSSSFTGTLLATNPTFTVNQGFTGNASGAMDTGFVPGTNGVNFTRNSASAFVCILNNRTSTAGTLISFGGESGVGSYAEPSVQISCTGLPR